MLSDYPKMSTSRRLWEQILLETRGNINSQDCTPLNLFSSMEDLCAPYCLGVSYEKMQVMKI